MNIFYLCADPGIPIRGTKGAAIHLRAMIGAFAELGHAVTLITPRAGPEDGNAPNARIVQAAPRSASDDREEQAREIARAVQQAATDELERDRCDLIYERYSLWSDAGAQLAQSSGLPLVLEVNAPLVVEASRYRALNRTDLAAGIERKIFSDARVITVVSNALRDYVTAHGARAERVHVLPNAVDEKFFHPAVDGSAIRTCLGLKEKFVIGFVGTLKPWHDLDVLIAAVRRLRAQATRDYHLLLVGDIPEAVRAEIARSLPNATTVIGPIPHGDVPAHIAAMDVAVSPHPRTLAPLPRGDLKQAHQTGANVQKLDDFYFSPLKLFEYLACGVATVAADVAPIREVVADGETAWLYPPGDASALAQMIEMLARDRHLRARIAWAGAQRVLGQHTWKQNAEQVIARVGGKTICADEPALPLYDDKLGAYLYRATRADLATPWLAAVCARAKWDSSQIKILKYKPRRRCVIAYELANGSKEKFSVIGKVFKDGRGAAHFAFQRELWANGFATESADGITIAKPLAYIPEMQMLVQERAAGLTLDECVGSAHFSKRVEQSARAIAKLHSSPIRAHEEYTLGDELRQLTRWCAALITQQPERADTFSRQLDALCALASELPRADPTPAHRDFYYSQLLFSDRRVTLIDLDLFARADPTIDVANFIAHLRFLALQKFSDAHQLDADAARFLDVYTRACTKSAGKDFAARVAFYEAATYFRLLHVVLNRLPWANWFDSLAQLTEESIAKQP